MKIRWLTLNLKLFYSFWFIIWNYKCLDYGITCILMHCTIYDKKTTLWFLSIDRYENVTLLSQAYVFSAEAKTIVFPPNWSQTMDDSERSKSRVNELVPWNFQPIIKSCRREMTCWRWIVRRIHNAGRREQPVWQSIATLTIDCVALEDLVFRLVSHKVCKKSWKLIFYGTLYEYVYKSNDF